MPLLTSRTRQLGQEFKHLQGKHVSMLAAFAAFEKSEDYSVIASDPLAFDLRRRLREHEQLLRSVKDARYSLQVTDAEFQTLNTYNRAYNQRARDWGSWMASLVLFWTQSFGLRSFVKIHLNSLYQRATDFGRHVKRIESEWTGLQTAIDGYFKEQQQALQRQVQFHQQQKRQPYQGQVNARVTAVTQSMAKAEQRMATFIKQKFATLSSTQLGAVDHKIIEYQRLLKKCKKTHAWLQQNINSVLGQRRSFKAGTQSWSTWLLSFILGTTPFNQRYSYRMGLGVITPQLKKAERLLAQLDKRYAQIVKLTQGVKTQATPRNKLREALDISTENLDPGKQYPDWTHQTIEDESHRRAQLPEGDFRHCVLRNIDFSHAQLLKANFSKPSEKDSTLLEKVNFSHANCGFTRYHGTTLNQCMWPHADLSYAEFNKASGKDVSFGSADCSHASFIEAKFQKADYRDSVCTSTDFSGAQLASSIFVGSDCRNAIFRGADLSNADLTDATVDYGDFSYASLKLATLPDLSKAKHFYKTNFTSCDLSKRALTTPRFIGCDFRLSNLSGSNLSGNTLTGSDFQFADLAEAVMSRAQADNVTLASAKMQKARCHRISLKGANLNQVKAKEALFDLADMQNCKAEGADFESADMYKVNLQDAHCKHANFGDAYLAKANLRNIDCTRADFNHAVLEGADLTGAETKLEGVTWKFVVFDKHTKMDWEKWGYNIISQMIEQSHKQDKWTNTERDAVINTFKIIVPHLNEAKQLQPLKDRIKSQPGLIFQGLEQRINELTKDNLANGLAATQNNLQ